MARKILFISLEEIAKYYPFADTLIFTDLIPTLKGVERNYLKPEIDADTWTAILAELDLSTPSNDTWAELIDRTCQAAAYLVALQHMDKANVIFSAAGLLVAKTDNTVPASEFRTQQLRRQLIKDSQVSLDNVFGHMEDNLAVFTDWASSDERGELSQAIIRTAAEFEQVYSISENRWIFRKLVARQKLVISAQIRGELGNEFIDAYIADMADGALNASHETIKPRLHSAIAYLTMGESIPALQQQFGPEGIALFDSEFSRFQGKRQDGDLSRIHFLRNDALEKGMQELRALKQYLDEKASADLFAEYFGSPNYTNPAVDETDTNDYDTPQNHFHL